MSFQIDQSIRIEDTRRATFVCIANDAVSCSSISAVEKRLLEVYFKKINRPLIYKLFTFSVLCAKVIYVVKASHATIDEEYVGHRRNIKSFIKQLMAIHNAPHCDIYFDSIGKKSKAHLEAYKAYKTNKRGIAITSDEILRLYQKINKG